MLCPKCEHVFALLVALLVWRASVCLGASVRINDYAVQLRRFHYGGRHQETTVHRFARHFLCRNIDGKRRFSVALEDHLCELSKSLANSLVLDLCRRKDHMLDKWVAELYDSDGDGYITHQERSYFDD